MAEKVLKMVGKKKSPEASVLLYHCLVVIHAFEGAVVFPPTPLPNAQVYLPDNIISL